MQGRLKAVQLNNIVPWLMLHVLISVAVTKVLMNTVSNDNFIWHWAAFVGAKFQLVIVEVSQVERNFNFDQFNQLAGVFVVVYCAAIVMHIALKWAISKTKVDYVHSSGIPLLSGSKVKAHAIRALKKAKQSAALFLHPDIPVSDKILTGNIFVFGAQGSGKSTIIKSLLVQLATTKHRLFVFDLKHEYAPFTDAQHKQILRVDIKNGVYWDISADVNDESDAASVSVALIEDADDDNRFFTDAAREIVKGVLIVLLDRKGNWSWGDFTQRLFAPREQLHSMLVKAYPPAGSLVEEDNKTTQSIRAVIATRLGWLHQMTKNVRSANTAFSLKNWLQDHTQRNQVVFQPDPKEVLMSKSVCNAITSLISSHLLSMPDQETKQTWMILDELGNLPKSPSLEAWLTLSRSKGGRCIAGVQSLSMLSKYGERGSETLLALFRTNIVLGLGAAGKSAQSASEAIGNHRVLSVQRTLSESGKVSLSEQFSDRAIVSAEDIINIPEPDKKGVCGYAVIGGRKAVYNLKWPYPITLQRSKTR